MRRLLVATVVVLAALLAAVLSAPILVPAGFLRARVAALVTQKTGRELRIAGPISVTLLPSPTLSARDVALASPSGGFTTDFLTIPNVEVSFEPFALLRGEIEIEQLTLSHPTISFEVDKDGRRNWIFPRPAKAAPAATSSAGGGPSLASGNLTIVDGVANYLDRRGGKPRGATGIALAAALPSPAGPLSAAGTATYNGENVRLAFSLESPSALRDGNRSAASLDIASQRGALGFRGDIFGSGAVKASGALNLKVPSLRDFLAWTQIRSGGDCGPASIEGEAELGGSRLTLSHATIVLAGSTARGAVTLERGGARPMISGRLDVDRLDIDAGRKERQQPAPTNTPPPGASPGASPGANPASNPPHLPAPPATAWSDSVIDLAPLKVADADLNLTADAVRLRHVVVGKSVIGLRLANGRLDLDIPEMALYGGAGSGKIVVDGSASVPAFGARFTLTGVTVEHVPIDIAGLGELSGTGNLSFELIGRGASERAIVASLNGIAGIAFANGTVGSAGLGPLLKNELGPAIGADSIPREIAYTALSATATINRGILRNGDLKLAGPKMSATGAGALDLVQRRLDYLWLPDIADLGNARIAISGGWDAPAYKVESVTITKGTQPAAPTPKRR